jgi:hypothetical protein
MSYRLTLRCGCRVRVSGASGTAPTYVRRIEKRGCTCRHHRHQPGRRVWLWELLPDSDDQTASLELLVF